jgi:DNA-binding GntR family transcriptional regulator
MAGARDSTVVVHKRLREAILSGELAAGSELAQAQMAKQFGVSRGPVREAFRLLEREGLIIAEVNQRARVAPFSIEDLEQLYAVRIVTEALGVALTVPRLTSDELDALDTALAEMDALAGSDVVAWEQVHQRFHRLLACHAGARIERLGLDCFEHAERYRRKYVTGEPRAWSQGAAEHSEIVEACRARDAALASAHLARHLSRTALTVLMLVAPEPEPQTVRAAVRQVTGPVSPTALGDPLAVRTRRPRQLRRPAG